jgi:hypothetical protein
MTATHEFLSMIEDQTIGLDAWEDYYLDEAIELAEKLRESGDLEKCLQAASSFSEDAKIRLFHVLLDVPLPEIFPNLLQILSKAHGELAEVLIDGLRFWPLEIDQRKQLILIAEKFSGQSKLLDRIINDLASKQY